MIGTVKWFNYAGYGFVTDKEGKDHFLHHSNIQMDGFKRLDEGDIVEFEVGNGSTGREQAVNVKPIITRKIVAHELSKERLHMKPVRDNVGNKKYVILDADNFIKAGENRLSLIDVAAYAGIDVEGLE